MVMKQYYLVGLLFWTACLLAGGVAPAQNVAANPDVATAQLTIANTTHLLFTQDSIMPLTLTATLRVLLKDRGEKPTAHPATLTYTNHRQIGCPICHLR